MRKRRECIGRTPRSHDQPYQHTPTHTGNNTPNKQTNTRQTGLKALHTTAAGTNRTACNTHTTSGPTAGMLREEGEHI